MEKNRSLVLSAGILAVLLSVCSPAAGGEREKSLTVRRLEAPPKIDGRLDDTCWRGLEPASGFIQHNPLNGQPAREETFVWAAYDQGRIYFAFLMKDSQPGKIWAELTPRNDFGNNDAVTVILDTYNDERTSVEFTVNPKGVQKNSVETIWQSEAVLLPDGWSVEMAIPFKSLRFSAERTQVWGVNFKRYIHRLNETDYWTRVDRDRPLLQQMGELTGLAGIRPGYNLEFFPYAGFRSTRWDGEADDKLAAGLDVKYGILPNLILDLTASPDFSEVESDPFLYQLSPYENYLQENRPFFTEGSRYFRLATESDGFHGPSASLFYSRRVGDPRFAAKLSGKAAGFSFGLLGARNREEDGDETFSVVRVQKDIFRNSQVGVYYAGVEDGGGFNRNIALDYSFQLGAATYLRGMNALSFTEGAERGRNGVHLFRFQHEPDAGWQASLSAQRVEAGARLSTGFLDAVDIQSLEWGAAYAWRFNRGTLQRFSLDFMGEFRQDAGGRSTGENLRFMFWTEFFSRVEVHGGIDAGRSKYQVVGEGGSLSWTPDFFRTWGADLDFDWERGGFLKEISLEGGWEKGGIYNGDFTRIEPGRQASLEGGLTLRPRSNLELSVGGDWIRQVLDRTGEVVFDGLTFAASLHFQATRSLFLSARLLGETREDQYNLDALLGYCFGAGNVVQLSYKKSARTEALRREGGHSLTLKVSYLFRV